MKAAELLKRYANGERDFRGANLRGQSFKGCDLSGADFSGADIRSTNFTGATLCGANFSRAKAGLQKRWAIGLLLVLWMLAGLAGFFLAFSSYLVTLMFSSNFSEVIAGWVALSSLVVFLMFFTEGVSIFAFVIIGAVIGAIISGPGSAAGVVLGSVAGTVAGIVVFAGTITGVIAVAGKNAGEVSCLFALVGFNLNNIVMDVDTFISPVVLVTVVVMGLFVGLSYGIGWHALREAPIYDLIRSLSMTFAPEIYPPRDAWIRSLAIAFAAICGTSFRNANLTRTNFTQAKLKSTDLRSANLRLTNWHQAKKLDRARVGGTILLNPKVKDLVATHRGKGQSYRGLDLQGAHLVGADLSDADLAEADISNAALAGAWLERANLTKTQALGTNFHEARLTGACLEAWNIDSTTRLDGAICNYVYLLNGQRERQPGSGNFEPGEFAKLFEEVLDTINLIFRNGVDWKAFIASFKQVQVENEGTELSIQSIENKGDGVVVVRVSVPPETNKEEIHSDFTRNYEAELATLKAQYQARLAAKEEQIAFYREKSADLKEIIGLLASRPIDVSVQATAQSEAMQHSNDINQTVSGSPGSNISAFQGDRNQVAQTQANQSPSPLSQADVVELLAQIKRLIDAAAIPHEVKIEANAHLKTAQKATDREDPEKKVALATLRNMAETLEATSKTVEAGKTLWSQVAPILVEVAGWLGAAAGSWLMRL